MFIGCASLRACTWSLQPVHLSIRVHKLPADVGQSSGLPGGFYRALVRNPGLWKDRRWSQDIRQELGEEQVSQSSADRMDPPETLNVLPDRTVSCGGPGLTAHQPDDPVSGRINELWFHFGPTVVKLLVGLSKLESKNQLLTSLTSSQPA